MCLGMNPDILKLENAVLQPRIVTSKDAKVRAGESSRQPDHGRGAAIEGHFVDVRQYQLN